jgi:hypothetical protein
MMLSPARRTSFIGGSIALAAVFLVSALATADPPDRVARLSFLSGSVSFRQATVDDWVVATLNYPMTTGDNLWTDAAGRAELQLGSVVVRLAANTSLSILNLDDRAAQLRLAQGTLLVSVRDIDLPLGEIVEIDTPYGAVSLEQRGLYRIDVGVTGDQTTVTVRHGTADVSIGTTTFDVDDNRSATVAGLTAPSNSVGDAEQTDEWEDWCQWRERRVDSVRAQLYVSRDVIGYDDLDEAGVWDTDADYGPIWIPHVSADWAPYRFGHWVWNEPWGWTWIDDAPWGFAPFHYGRWVTLRGSWAWVPGDFFARPVYAPALVAFVAGDWDVRVSLDSGEPIAWIPLGPGEAFVRSHQVSSGYLQAIDAAQGIVADINTTNVTYVNRTVPGAMTAVPRDAFVQGRPVSPVVVRVSAEFSRTATIVGSTAPVAPEAVSVLGQSARGVPPPASVLSRQVVTRTAPPPPPVPVAVRQPH